MQRIQNSTNYKLNYFNYKIMVITKKKKDRQKRNENIVKIYKNIFIEGSNIMAICEKIANKVGVSAITVYKVLRTK